MQLKNTPLITRECIFGQENSIHLSLIDEWCLNGIKI